LPTRRVRARPPECHRTADDGGFIVTELDVYYEEGTPKVLGANSLGIARPS
jgi:hypothetical protein